jgi:uncharacterized protein
VCGFRIGITHGHGKGKTTKKRAIAAFEDEKVDCIIFGHSHIPVMGFEGDITLQSRFTNGQKKTEVVFFWSDLHK